MVMATTKPVYSYICTEWERAFQLSDEDQSGLISWVELRTLCSYIGKPATDSELKLMLREADSDGDGFITFQEFFTMMVNRTKKEFRKQEEELLTAFRVFDKDNDGFITHAELKEAMHSSGYMLNDEEVLCMINQADQDGDGQINFREFIQLMKDH
jgi:calmodulin